MSDFLFSYGTLQREQVQVDLFGRVLNGSRDVLPGYTKTTVEITDPVFLAKGEKVQQQTLVVTNNDDDRVEGMVFEVSEDELLHADKYEPINYKRVLVKLGSGREAWVYLMSGEW